MSPSPVVNGVSCPRCAAGVEREARFCARCGLGLASTPAVVATPAVAPVTTDASAPPSAGPPAPPAPAPPAGPPAPLAGSEAAPSPSAIGRRAGAVGWAGVGLLAVGFFAAASGVLLAARTPGSAAVPSPEPPLARFDPVLNDGTSIADATPFTIDVEARNPAVAPTDRLWIVIDWVPAGRASTAGMRGSFVACEPADCTAHDDAAAARTIVSWPGLAPGGRRVFRVTVAAAGLLTGTSLGYRVRTGTGATNESMLGGLTWDLHLEVR